MESPSSCCVRAQRGDSRLIFNKPVDAGSYQDEGNDMLRYGVVEAVDVASGGCCFCTED